MKGIWRGEDDELGLRCGREYEIIGYSETFDAYGVVDEVGATYQPPIAYFYPREEFEITEEYPAPQAREA